MNNNYIRHFFSLHQFHNWMLAYGSFLVLSLTLLSFSEAEHYPVFGSAGTDIVLYGLLITWTCGFKPNIRLAHLAAFLLWMTALFQPTSCDLAPVGTNCTDPAFHIILMTFPPFLWMMPYIANSLRYPLRNKFLYFPILVLLTVMIPMLLWYALPQSEGLYIVMNAGLLFVLVAALLKGFHDRQEQKKAAVEAVSENVEV